MYYIHFRGYNTGEEQEGKRGEDDIPQTCCIKLHESILLITFEHTFDHLSERINKRRGSVRVMEGRSRM